MTDRFTDRFGRFGKSIAKGAPPPASPCPACYSVGIVLGFKPGTDTLAFECVCGCRWVTSGKQAKAHALWLHKRSNMGRNLDT